MNQLLRKQKLDTIKKARHLNESCLLLFYDNRYDIVTLNSTAFDPKTVEVLFYASPYCDLKSLESKGILNLD